MGERKKKKNLAEKLNLPKELSGSLRSLNDGTFRIEHNGVDAFDGTQASSVTSCLMFVISTMSAANFCKQKAIKKLMKDELKNF